MSTAPDDSTTEERVMRRLRTVADMIESGLPAPLRISANADGSIEVQPHWRNFETWREALCIEPPRWRSIDRGYVADWDDDTRTIRLSCWAPELIGTAS